MSGLSFGSARLGSQQAAAPSFVGSTQALHPRLQNQRRSTQLRVVSERVLIANTKGGGHAFIGLHLAQQLLSKGHEVTILNDGEEVGRWQYTPCSVFCVSVLLPCRVSGAGQSRCPHSCSILQGKQTKKAPYSQYPSLKEAGAQIVWGDPASPESLPSIDFDVVIDNNGKTLESCKPLIDAFKVKPLECSEQLL